MYILRFLGSEAMQDLKEFFSAEDKFARHAGIELVDMGPGWAKVRMKIEPFHLNGAKTVHGGAMFTLADFAFAVASNSHGNLAMGINTSMSFVKAGLKGTLYAEAKELSLNPKLASYSVMITDDEVMSWRCSREWSIEKKSLLSRRLTNSLL